MKELEVTRLRSECNPGLVRCDHTNDIAPLEEIVGQERAVKALKFGLDINEQGFNIYVAGLPGSGRTTAVRDFVEEISKDKPIPSDWCYVNNFSDPFLPKAIKLPPGRGKELQKSMKNLVGQIRDALPKVFESEDYAIKREAVLSTIEEERNGLLSQLNNRAQKEGFVLQSSPIGLLIIPVVKGKPLNDQELIGLPAQLRNEIEEKRETLRKELRSAFRQLRFLERRGNEEIQRLNREVAMYAIGDLVESLTEEYKGYPDVETYIEEVENDVLENITLFISGPQPPSQAQFPLPWMEELPFRKY
ncbi:MAG: AAA family ATPase, partial [Candidatus Bathyarchaeota archaeon]